MTYQTRPLTQLAKPTVLSGAFADPDAVLDLIRIGAPYKTQEAAHKHPNVTRTAGWFRNFWALGGKVVFEGAEALLSQPHISSRPPRTALAPKSCAPSQ